jgi:RHS repeat-associated protein
VYQHLEYFPYGETWVEEGGSGQMPYYRFTGKELDPETGLYYYGARYYDPVLSRWISADPILGEYLPNQLDKRQLEKDWKPERNLPGMGGVFKSLNLGLYSYAHYNPLKFVDPLGLATDSLPPTNSVLGVPDPNIMRGVPTGNVTIGQIPNMANLFDQFNKWVPADLALNLLVNEIEPAIRAKQWDIEYGTSKQFGVLYGTMPFRFIGLVKPGLYYVPEDVRYYEVTIEGLAGPKNWYRYYEMGRYTYPYDPMICIECHHPSPEVKQYEYRAIK